MPRTPYANQNIQRMVNYLRCNDTYRDLAFSKFGTRLVDTEVGEFGPGCTTKSVSTSGRGGGAGSAGGAGAGGGSGSGSRSGGTRVPRQALGIIWHERRGWFKCRTVGGMTYNRSARCRLRQQHKWCHQPSQYPAHHSSRTVDQHLKRGKETRTTHSALAVKG